MKKTLAAVVATRGLGLAVALLFGVALAQKPADVHGWGKVKWGMTLVQIQKLYPEAQPTTRTNYNQTTQLGLVIPKFDLINLPFTVTFWERPTDKQVSSVEVTAPHGDASIAAFAQLETPLMHRYGEPALRENNETIGSRSLTWKFPSSEIRLWIVGRESAGIIYERVNKRTRGKP
jgi:hypothetical protein